MKTIKDCLNRAADQHPDSVALMFKESGGWKTVSFSELRERAWQVSEILVRQGIRPGDRVALFRENSPEWYELYHGIVGIGAIAVPVDAKLREQEVAHILHDCDVSLIFCSAKLLEVLSGLDGGFPLLKAIITVGPDRPDVPVPGQVEVFDYSMLCEEVRVQALSAERSFDRFGPEEDAPASYIYTSGTTGRQKGAVLTHRNFIANVESILKSIDFQLNDNILLILPLHHSFAFTTTLVVPIYVQCQVTLVESMKTIKANMEETAPTVMLAVPLLLEKMLARIESSINSSPVARTLMKIGLAGVIGKKVKKGLGGALRLVVSGGAPISKSTLEAWTKLGFPIVEGYGITETAPVLAVNPLGRPRVGTVGIPLEGVEVRIDNPNEQGVGEIIAKGENVMQGYHNNPEETAKVLKDGWYHTGDMGYFDEKGYLVINGRKKCLIVNREGKNIYPEEVELRALKSRLVLECLALGYREPGGETGERVGIIAVPDEEVFDALQKEAGRNFTDVQIEEMIRTDVQQCMSALSDYKRPRRIQVQFEPFDKTSTQKIKRYLYAIDTSRS
jgi:long-chain acyl-CoA synthetase